MSLILLDDVLHVSSSTAPVRRVCKPASWTGRNGRAASAPHAGQRRGLKDAWQTHGVVCAAKARSGCRQRGHSA